MLFLHLLLLSCLQLTLILKPKWHIWGCVLCYPSGVHELILFKRTQPCVWYRRGALREYASSCIGEHLACEFSELHPLSLQRATVLGASNFQQRAADRFIQKRTRPRGKKLFFLQFVFFYFITYKNKEPK